MFFYVIRIVNQVGNKAVVLGLHKSSSSLLYSSTAEDIANAIGTSGQPYWTLNGVGLGSYNSSIQTTVVNTINSTYNATTTDVNAGFEWFIQNDTLYVETLTAFFNAANGDFNVAVYLSEDSIYEYQANYDPQIPNGNIYHNHILRTSLSQDALGEQVVSGAVTAGASYTNFHKIRVDPSWDLDQIHLSTVVWQDNGGSYTFKNANDVGLEVLSTSVSLNQKEDVQLNIYPNPTSDFLTVTSTNLAESSLIRMYDIAGRIVYQKKLEDNSDFTMRINVSNLSSGEYVLSIVSDGTIASKQVVIK